MKPLCRAYGWGILLALAACAPHNPRPSPVDVDSKSVFILRPHDVGIYTQLAESVLSEAFPEATTFPLSRFEEAFARALGERAVLVIPAIGYLPSELWEPLTDYLNRGGAAVFWGRDPFQRRVWSSPAGLQTEERLVRDMVGRAQDVPGLPPVRQWRHVNDSGRLKGAIHIARHADLPWPGVQVDVDDLREWDHLWSEPLPAGAITDSIDTFLFFARGEADTTYLTLRVIDRDGSRWSRVISVAESWRPYLLHEEDFRLEDTPSLRGNGGEHPDFSQLSQITIGLDMMRGTQPPGRHVFGISNLRAVADPRPRAQALGWPDLPMLSPPSRRYDTAVTSIKLAESETSVRIWDAPVSSPLPLPQGVGGTNGAPYRWIPMAEATRVNPVVVSWPASLYVEPRSASNILQWAWIGVTVPDRALVVAMLRGCAGRLQRGQFLHHAGSEKYVYERGEIINVSVACTPGRPGAPASRVAVELLLADGSLVRRKTAVRKTAPEGEVWTASLGTAPMPREESELYLVRVVLTDPAGRELLDAVTQRIKVIAPERQVRKDAWVSANGPAFSIGSRAIFPFALAYQPLAAPTSASWLDPVEFRPDALSHDLDLLRDVGINTLVLRYGHEKEALQLRYVVDEARLRRFWVVLSLPRLGPGEVDLQMIRRLMEAARIRNESRVLAVDVPCAPDLHAEADRRALDPAWRTWLVEQFGTFAHAEEVFDLPLRREQGEVVGPTDAEFATNGPHRIQVETYRRFLDDWISRRCGEVRRLFKEMGLRQLLTSTAGGLWSEERWVSDPAAGAAHLDYISISARNLLGGRDDFAGAAFLPAYVRGASGSKPVWWSDIGASVGAAPRPLDEANQARVHEGMLDLVRLSRAAGCGAWRYPGGWREADDSDYGVVRPDGTWRPAGNAMRNFARQMRDQMVQVRPWRGRECDRAADARGVAGLLEKWSETYIAEMRDDKSEEIRPLGFGQETAGMPSLSVGNVPHADPAPMALVNAEWGDVLVNDRSLARRPGQVLRVQPQDKLKLELINTGPATWSAGGDGRAGTVDLRAHGAGGRDQFMAVPGRAFGGRVVLEWIATDAGRWEFRPWLRDAGGFGELLVVEVADGG